MVPFRKRLQGGFDPDGLAGFGAADQISPPGAVLSQKGKKHVFEFGDPFGGIQRRPGLPDEIDGTKAMHGGKGVVDERIAAFLGQEGDALGAMSQCQEQSLMHRFGLPLGLRALGELLRALTEVQLAHDLSGQSGEGLLLLLADMAGMTVEHAEGADRMAVGSEEWNSCIESNERLSRDHRMIRESKISQGIRKHDGMRLHDGMGAERAISR